MAGYVVMKLLKKVTKTCTDEKHRAFEGNRSGRGISAGGLHQSLGGTGEPRWSVLGDERGNKMIVACIHASNSYSLVSTSGSAADGGDRDDYEEVQVHS